MALGANYFQGIPAVFWAQEIIAFSSVGQVGLGILLVALGGLLLGHRLFSGRWLTGQTAFTGPWFISLCLLAVYPVSRDFISGEAVWIILFAHGAYCVGSVLTYRLIKRRERIRSEYLEPSISCRKALRVEFYILTTIGVFGSFLLAYTSGAFISAIAGNLVSLRAEVLNSEVRFTILQRLMSNFIYPAAIIGAIRFIYRSDLRGAWLNLVFPAIGLFLFSLSNGGRGTILIGGLLIFWAIAVGRSVGVGRQGFKGTALIGSLGLSVAGYIGYIAMTRSGPADIIWSIFQYITGPIPSFCDFYAHQRYSIPLINFDLSSFAIIRELMNAIGFDIQRVIDRNIVYIPFQFNVFTHLAEHLLAFGVAGLVVVSLLLGILLATLENRPVSIYVLGIRSVLYTYLSFSLFADLSFFIVGWWLALLAVAIFLPALEWFLHSISPRAQMIV